MRMTILIAIANCNVGIAEVPEKAMNHRVANEPILKRKEGSKCMWAKSGDGGQQWREQRAINRWPENNDKSPICQTGPHKHAPVCRRCVGLGEPTGTTEKRMPFWAR